jgi:hypothetical protein
MDTTDTTATTIRIRALTMHIQLMIKRTSTTPVQEMTTPILGLITMTMVAESFRILEPIQHRTCPLLAVAMLS